MTTSPKGFTQVAGSNPPNGPAQINAAELFVENLIGEHVTDASSLPSSGNWPGRLVLVTSDGLLRISDGTDTGWKVINGLLGAKALAVSGTLTTSYTTLSGLSLSVVTPAVPVWVRTTVQLDNAGSGADRTANLQLFEDSTAISTPRLFTVPLAGSGGFVAPTLTVFHTPSAGTHTYTVKASASINSAITLGDCDISVTIVP